LGETLPNGDFLFFIYKIYFILFFQTGKNWMLFEFDSFQNLKNKPNFKNILLDFVRSFSR
jgi:hypothetical protein